MTDRAKAIISIIYLFAASLASLYLISGGHEDYGARNYFVPGENLLIQDAKLRNQFSEDESLYVLFEGPDLFKKDFLKKMELLRQRLIEYELISSVRSISNVDHITIVDDGFDIRPMVDIDDIENTTETERRARTSKNRFAIGNLVSKHLDAYAFQLIPKLNATNTDPIVEIFQKESEKLGLDKNVTAKAGALANTIAQKKVSNENIFLLIPIILILGVLLLWWLFRRVFPILITVFVIGHSSLVATAVFPVFGQPYCILTTLISVILSAIGLAFVIHLFNAIVHAASRGENAKNRVLTAVRAVAKPSLFSALTTAVGLASLAMGQLPPVKWFGFSTAFGVIYLCFLTLVLVPNILIGIDTKDWSKKSGFYQLNKWIAVLANTGIRYSRQVIFVSVAIILGLLPLIPQINVETNILKFFRKDHEIVVSTGKIENKLSGISSIEVLLESEPDGLKKTEVMKAMHEFQDWVISQPEVDFVMSHADIIEEMNWAFQGDPNGQRALPTNQDLVDQYLMINSGETIWDFVDTDFSIARIPLRLNIHGSQKLSKSIARINKKLEETMPKYVKYEVLGISRLFSELTTRVIQSQIKSLGTAALLILFLMIFSWRNLTVSLVCMIPNLAPLVIAFTLMVVFSIFLDFATSMFASLALGIAVDDTIHIFYSFKKYYARSGNTVWSISRAYRHSGRAILATTIILCLQYAVVLSSSYLPFTNFSLVMIISLMSALLFDLVLLPAILIALFPPRKSSASAVSPSQKVA